MLYEEGDNLSDYAINDPIYDIFIFETLKILDEIEVMVLECEKKSNFNDYKNIITRNIHTIKGNAMTLDIDDIAKLSHACEDLVCNINRNKVENVMDIADIILEYIDYLRGRLDNLNDNDSSEEIYSRILIRIEGLMKNNNVYRRNSI